MQTVIKFLSFYNKKKFITIYYSVWNINDGKFLSHFLSICINFDISYFILFYLHICHPSSLYSDDKFSLFFPFTIFVPVSWFCANKLMNSSILIKTIESVLWMSFLGVWMKSSSLFQKIFKEISKKRNKNRFKMIWGKCKHKNVLKFQQHKGSNQRKLIMSDNLLIG